nr:tetratricopeptide repeat protein [Bacteroidota bacterium]
MMIKRLFMIGCMGIMFFLGPIGIVAQQTKIYDNPVASFNTALDLIEKKQFGAAQEVFINLMSDIGPGASIMRLEATYYNALCDYRLDHPQAKEKFSTFIRQYPDHSKTNQAYLYLGFINYSNRKYKDAIENFENVDTYRITSEELTNLLYKLGYCYLQTEDNAKAKEAFFPILNTESDFRNAANYYYAYISYINKDYNEALKYFQLVKNDPEFGKEIPYYLLQINYINHDYQSIVREGPALLQTRIRDKSKLAETARLIAEAFYKEGKYAESLQYFDLFNKNSKRDATRDETYQMAYANFAAGKYETAIKLFQKTVKDKDATSQNAYYHLGDCYLKTGQKQFAQNAFYSAFQMDFDPKIQEDALFNYAKLCHELAYDPFNAAIEALKDYISNYPGSERIDEAYSYLTNLFLSTKDYPSAIAAIENIRVKNSELKAAYQKITYLYGVQLFNSNKFDEAQDSFRKSLGYNYNIELTAQAKFWMGETHFRSQDFHKAIDYYDNFMTTPGAYDLEIYPIAKYNLAYTYFKLKYYDNAVIAFEQFVNRPVSGLNDYKTDAVLRMGDCYFITKNYENAIDYYERAIIRKSPDSDYALFQKGISQGVLGNDFQKINTLKTLISKYPNSHYRDDAYYKIGETYLLTNDNDNALSWFNKIISGFPNSSYYLKSLQKAGLAYYNKNSYDKALEILKKVVSDYPGTTESKEALSTIRNIYMDKNQVNEYFAYAGTVPFANVTTSEQDSITYLAAENIYMNNECGPAVNAFGEYIRNFPNGSFILNANYYKAECEYNADLLESALEGYEVVIAHPKSRFTENALLKAAEIHLLYGQYTEALENYLALEQNADYQNNVTTAIYGQMESYFGLGQYPPSMASSKRLLERERLDNEQILAAHYITAKSALSMDSIAVATDEFEKTIELSEGEKGAEAMYLLAAIQYQLKNNNRAEALIFELANKYPSFEYWKAKGFIMLADIYAVNGNLFQAKHTLQSIIDNYPGDDLKEIAAQKLTTIVRQEQKEMQLQNDSLNPNKSR